MNKSLLALAIAIAIASPLAWGQQSISTGTGGSGGAGGSAAGGQAAGGAATNSNNTSGVSNATGGLGGSASGGQGGVANAAGGTSNAAGGAANAGGGNVGTVSTGGSQASLGDVTVNYNVPGGPLGKAGLGVGVDPDTGHIVTDNKIKYEGSYKLKNTPDVSLGGPASGPCNGFSAGIGIGLPGMSLGGNMSKVDKGCEARETARVAAMLGRMDIANAVLEHIGIVEEALNAKAERDGKARLSSVAVQAPAASMMPATTAPVQQPATMPTPATTAPLQSAPAPVATPPTQAQIEREALLKEQQRLAQEALQRQATMAKVNDTLKFTDATTQANEKTPQQLMAEELANKQTALLAQEQARRLAPQMAEESTRKQAAQWADESGPEQAARAAWSKRRQVEQAAEEATRQQAAQIAEESARNQVAEESARRQAVQAADDSARTARSQAANQQRGPSASQNDGARGGQVPGQHAATQEASGREESGARRAVETAADGANENIAPVVEPARKRRLPVDALEALNLLSQPRLVPVAANQAPRSRQDSPGASKQDDSSPALNKEALRARAIQALSLDGNKERTEVAASEKGSLSQVALRQP